MDILDYGTGGGAFAEAMADLVGPTGRVVGTDASREMIRYAEASFHRPNLSFMHWDATQTELVGTLDLAIAKLSLNYVSTEDLRQRELFLPHDLRPRVLERLRSCLKETGLLVVVMPNPYKEAGTDQETYYNTAQVPIQVGKFGDELTATAYHHSVDSVLDAAYTAGFPFARVLTLPRVDFETGRQIPPDPETPVLPVEHGVLDQSSKRLMYVFGAGIASVDAYLEAIDRHNDWLAQTFPDQP